MNVTNAFVDLINLNFANPVETWFYFSSTKESSINGI